MSKTELRSELLRATSDPEAVELLLYGEIGGWRISVGNVTAAIDEACRHFKRMDVRLHTNGGSVGVGWVIFNRLVDCGIEVNTLVDGFAASMGSVIMMAGKRIRMNKYSMAMIHQPRGGANGTAKELRSVASALDEIEKMLVQAYCEKSGMAEAKVREMLLAETWLSPQKALELKFIDEIYDGQRPQNLPAEPAALGRSAFAALFDPFFKNDFKNSKPHNPSDMDKKEITKLLGLDPVASDEAVMAHLAAMKTDRDKFKSEAEKLEELTRKTQADELKALLDKAVEDRKVVAEHRSIYEDLGRKDLGQLKALLDTIQPQAKITDVIAQAKAGKESESGDTRAWTFEDWQKKDPEGLADMEAKKPDQFDKLLNAYLNSH